MGSWTCTLNPSSPDLLVIVIAPAGKLLFPSGPSQISFSVWSNLEISFFSVTERSWENMLFLLWCTYEANFKSTSMNVSLCFDEAKCWYSLLSGTIKVMHHLTNIFLAFFLHFYIFRLNILLYKLFIFWYCFKV